MFRRKLREVPLGLDHPVWVEDPDFDIDRHVHRLAVPSPGGDLELSELCGHLAGLSIDRSGPLWELWAIEGLASGQVAVLLKMHHASVDGVSGANIFSHLCSLEPDSPPMESPATEPGSTRTPSDAELVGRAVLATLTRPVQAARLVEPTVRSISRTVGRIRRGTAMAAPLSAPRTSLNGTITGHRVVAWAEVPLDRIKAVKNAVEGSTVNDVVLAVSGGALRRYLDDRRELPDTSLLATVPVSVHGHESRRASANRVSSIFCHLGTDVADPLERLRRLSVSNRHSKEHGNAIPAEMLQEWAELAAPRTFGLAMRMVTGLRLAERGPVIHNLVISNVPGPPVPLYFMGARVDALYPLGPVFHGAGLNITVMSNAGRMHVGLIGCRESVPDVWELAAHFPRELDALHEAATGGR
jgi:diacylglycerol O-acyltransferase